MVLQYQGICFHFFPSYSSSGYFSLQRISLRSLYDARQSNSSLEPLCNPRMKLFQCSFFETHTGHHLWQTFYGSPNQILNTRVCLMINTRLHKIIIDIQATLIAAYRVIIARHFALPPFAHHHSPINIHKSAMTSSHNKMNKNVTNLSITPPF